MHCYEGFGNTPISKKKEKFVLKWRIPSSYFGFSLLNKTRRTAFQSYVLKKKTFYFTLFIHTLLSTKDTGIYSCCPAGRWLWMASTTLYSDCWVRTSPWVKLLLPGNFFLQNEKNPQRTLIPYANRLLAAAPPNFTNMPRHAWIFLIAKFRSPLH